MMVLKKLCVYVQSVTSNQLHFKLVILHVNLTIVNEMKRVDSNTQSN